MINRWWRRKDDKWWLIFDHLILRNTHNYQKYHITLYTDHIGYGTMESITQFACYLWIEKYFCDFPLYYTHFLGVKVLGLPYFLCPWAPFTLLRISSVLLPSWGMRRRYMRYLVNSQFFLSSWQMTVAWVVTGQTGRISLTQCFSGDLP